MQEKTVPVKEAQQAVWQVWQAVHQYLHKNGQCSDLRLATLTKERAIELVDYLRAVSEKE